MKKINSLLSLTLAIIIISTLLTVSLPVSAVENEGITFTSKDLYRPTKAYDSVPRTFEAWIKLPKNACDNRAGVILGNYNQTYCVINFEIYSSGNPRLYWANEKGKLFDLVFDEINVCTDEWTHIAIVRDVANKKADCYINGELKQSLLIKTDDGIVDENGFTEFIPTGGLCIGGDVRGGNDQYFKGAIKEAAVFSNVRTADQIASDMTSITNENGLLAHYVLSAENLQNTIKDLSSNGCDLKYIYNETWISEKDMPSFSDYEYCFAVVGDTQTLNYKYPDMYNSLYEWIVDSIEDKKIKFVFGLGDITDKSDFSEWQRAKQAIYSLDGKVDYSIVRGNHDHASMYNATFPWSKYKDNFEGSFDGTMLNTYRTLNVGQVKYLIITLDYGASNKVLQWAGDVCEQYPDHNVIITTHCYLFRDGTTLDQNDVCPPATTGGYNNGDDMWDKLVSKHENIVLVISGHDPYDEVVVSQVKGDKGNTVTQMLVDPQTTDSGNRGLGLVALLCFSEDGRNVDVKYYSTVRKMYYQTINQFSFNLHLVGEDSEILSDKAPETDTIRTEPSGCASTISLGAITLITVVFGIAFLPFIKIFDKL